MQQDSDEDQPGSPRRGSGGDGDGDGGYYLDSSSAGSSPRSPRSAGGTAALSPPSPARGGGAGARARAGAAGAGAGPRSPYRIDAVVLDGISLPLPLFAWIGIPSIFYCHFPDKLLVQVGVGVCILDVHGIWLVCIFIHSECPTCQLLCTNPLSLSSPHSTTTIRTSCQT